MSPEINDKIIQKDKIVCNACCFIEHDSVFGDICQHRASIEGIEVEKSFYQADEIKGICPLYEKKNIAEISEEDLIVAKMYIQDEIEKHPFCNELYTIQAILDKFTPAPKTKR